MDNAKVAGRSPCKLTLEPGRRYAWCSCGRSATQPWCDGQHRGTSFKPIVFEAPAEQDGPSYLCTCKQTRTGPRCDGSHGRIGSDVSELPPPTQG